MKKRRVVRIIIEIDLDSGKSLGVRVEGEKGKEANMLLEILKAVFA